MKIFMGILIGFVIVIAAGLIYIFSGSYNISALEEDKGLTRWVLETTMDNSVESHAKDIKVPSLEGDAMFKNGFNHFSKMCGCHGSPGKEPGKNFNPPPPELSRTVDDWKPNELFWIVKHGIKMSAMPTFGERLSDEEIWSVVAFLKKYPEITPAEYDSLKEANQPTRFERR